MWLMRNTGTFKFKDAYAVTFTFHRTIRNGLDRTTIHTLVIETFECDCFVCNVFGLFVYNSVFTIDSLIIEMLVIRLAFDSLNSSNISFFQLHSLSLSLCALPLPHLASRSGVITFEKIQYTNMEWITLFLICFALILFTHVIRRRPLVCISTGIPNTFQHGLIDESIGIWNDDDDDVVYNIFLYFFSFSLNELIKWKFSSESDVPTISSRASYSR